MRIFVTGGTGFIGRSVVRELHNQGHRMLLLSRQSGSALASLAIPNVDTIPGDLSNLDSWRSALAGFAPEAAIHLAWEGLPNYDVKTSRRNLDYGLNLITTLAEIGCKTVICAGSCWEYGQQPSGQLREDMVAAPFNAFTAAKDALHWLGRAMAKEKGVHFIWTRLFYVYGPGQRETSLIPHIINCVRRGEKPEIKTPLNRNDFVYVADVARAIASIAAKPQKDGLYNIGSGYSTSVKDIVDIVYNKFNRLEKYGMLTGVANNQVVDFWADISRIKSDIGWEPGTGIKEGIEQTIDYRLQDI